MTEPTATPAPAWMHFVNFDGRIDGRTAEILKQVAESRKVTPQDLLAEVLREGLKSREWLARPEDAKVEPMTINAGNGGFHVVTVVADGYGNLVAEDSAGTERARVKCAEDTDEAPADPADDLKRLMDAFDDTTS